MTLVKFTSALRRFEPGLSEIEVAGNNVSEVVHAIGDKYPKLLSYIIDESGALRKHVNIFIGNRMVQDREKLSDAVSEDDEVFIIQALSGG